MTETTVEWVPLSRTSVYYNPYVNTFFIRTLPSWATITCPRSTLLESFPSDPSRTRPLSSIPCKRLYASKTIFLVESTKEKVVDISCVDDWFTWTSDVHHTVVFYTEIVIIVSHAEPWHSQKLLLTYLSPAYKGERKREYEWEASNSFKYRTNIAGSSFKYRC